MSGNPFENIGSQEKQELRNKILSYCFESNSGEPRLADTPFNRATFDIMWERWSSGITETSVILIIPTILNYLGVRTTNAPGQSIISSEYRALLAIDVNNVATTMLE